IKVATSTSMVIIAVNDAAAAWIYIAKGAVLPMIVVPSVIGISIGARIGAKLAVKAKPVFVKYLVMAIMLLAAVLNIIKGLKGLHVI
ncbi:MAG TPA: sulfite exporter TauE/SafE family protein, partial [Thermodesulfobacteriaceae bacterium]|nr:sulfite exporter TauE/SafE family protein [Thermodesulfobacteriaceae bacterium]